MFFQWFFVSVQEGNLYLCGPGGNVPPQAVVSDADAMGPNTVEPWNMGDYPP